jgi:hypothetical protein
MKVKIGCHTFRATGITAYLEAGGTLENAQVMAAHESPRTTKLYDRTGDEITLGASSARASDGNSNFAILRDHHLRRSRALSVMAISMNGRGAMPAEA